MVDKLRRFLNVRSSLRHMEANPGLQSCDVSEVIQLISEGGSSTQPYFWRSLANLVDEKA